MSSSMMPEILSTGQTKEDSATTKQKSLTVPVPKRQVSVVRLGLEFSPSRCVGRSFCATKIPVNGKLTENFYKLESL